MTVAWTCEIIGVRPDGCFTWRKAGAAEPRGVLPSDLTPEGTTVGRIVQLHAERDWSGRWTVSACQLMPSEEVPPEAALPTEPAGLGVGQLRRASVQNPIEDPLSRGKERPTLLVSDEGLSWRVMGLTTKDHYEDGNPRTPIPDHLAVGLHGPGYLWGHRLTRIRTIDIGGYIGAADVPLIEAVIDLASQDLTAQEILDLRKSAPRSEDRHGTK